MSVKPKRTVFATWQVQPAKKSQTMGDLMARVTAFLNEECPISWGSDDGEQGGQFEGWSLEEGTLTLTPMGGTLVVHFEAPFRGRVPKEVWFSPCALFEDVDADTWGLSDDKEA